MGSEERRSRGTFDGVGADRRQDPTETRQAQTQLRLGADRSQTAQIEPRQSQMGPRWNLGSQVNSESAEPRQPREEPASLGEPSSCTLSMHPPPRLPAQMERRGFSPQTLPPPMSENVFSTSIEFPDNPKHPLLRKGGSCLCPQLPPEGEVARVACGYSDRTSGFSSLHQTQGCPDRPWLWEAQLISEKPPACPDALTSSQLPHGVSFPQSQSRSSASSLTSAP